jgi:hypothetical protein
VYRALALIVALTACGDDAAHDAAVVDIDNGSCGDQLRFTGEYVDWDTDRSFCGIAMAVIEVQGGAMDTTAPNGRFDLCIPRSQPTTRLVVTQPSGQSQCSSPASSYSVPTIFHANREVILAGGFFSGRAFTTVGQDAFFQSIGQPFDSSKAQVFVHVNGMPRPLSLAAAHGPAQAVATTTWAPGDAGHDVFFPNVDVGSGTTMLTSAGTIYGGNSIPLVAGTITNVAVILP